MKIKKLFVSLAGIVIFLFSSFTFANQNPLKTPDGIYTEDKQNISVDANNPEFTIKLKSNPTTGYSWFLREYDANLLSPIKHKFEKPAAQNSKMVGAPGYELWIFRVKPSAFLVPRQTMIRLIYARPWQGMDSSTQLVFRVMIFSQDHE